MAVSRTRAGDLVDSSDESHVVAQVNRFPGDVGGHFEPEWAALETSLELWCGPLGSDGRKK